MIESFWRLLKRSLSSRPAESELASELRVHLERLVAYNCRIGMPPEQAAADARRRLGALAWRDRL